MSCSASYTVVIIPLQNSRRSKEALRFFLWLKLLKELEKEKDCLCNGLEVLERARLWFCQQIYKLQCKQQVVGTNTLDWRVSAGHHHHQARIQEMNFCLNKLSSLMNMKPASYQLTGTHDVKQEIISAIQVKNRMLMKESSEKTLKISLLEQERNDLIQQLNELQSHIKHGCLPENAVPH
ncbi:suppressor APC domain-containing protein 1 [Erpetoichthys calabaricus]|uniref:suppressor APC domain-containing protein 1 n=1 Tax=Erpetoichthys calabaricus TaxID=27687 RepID=UPI00223448C1|nr:suppressor APC domain-containing protein 1 [Erpetoichthys calabaricus]XP_051790638.1 suppressor APC domain-containing protein 1 [Erpetoichthys calabaricus]